LLPDREDFEAVRGIASSSVTGFGEISHFLRNYFGVGRIFLKNIAQRQNYLGAIYFEKASKIQPTKL
jgi:hypothetical protein